MTESVYSYEAVQTAAKAVSERMGSQPEVGLILGSGLGILSEMIEQPVTVPYAELPHFPLSTVEGHAGELVAGTVGGRRVVMMKGRFHMYEGYDAQTVAFPVRVMKELGVSRLVVTNAAGGVNTDFHAGDLMLIRDHINWMGRSPLMGSNDSRFGVRFPDMSEAYSGRLRELARQTASELGIVLQQGVYLGLLGPAYETPAEVRMLRKLGADAVGMSTVPEVIAARHAGIEVLGLSCITNSAAGILDQPLSHAEVMETAERVKHTFLKLVLTIIPQL